MVSTNRISSVRPESDVSVISVTEASSGSVSVSVSVSVLVGSSGFFFPEFFLKTSMALSKASAIW